MTVQRKLPAHMMRDASTFSRAIQIAHNEALARGFSRSPYREVPQRFANVLCAWRKGAMWLVMHMDGTLSLTERE